MNTFRLTLIVALCGMARVSATAQTFQLLTGIDAGRYPGTARPVSPMPGPGFPGTFYDGDRLAGTSDTGPVVAYQGLGAPMFQPNQFGAASFLLRRGSIPVPPNNRVPIMGIEFLGGPLLDLDGDLGNGERRLTPVAGATPVTIPGTTSHLRLLFDATAGTVTIQDVDITGNNEGGPNIQPEIATTVTVVAGTTPTLGHTGPINPAFDTRTGTLTAYAGTSGTVQGVSRITGLQIELWHDSIDPNSASANVLGTFQHFAIFRGWLVRRNPATGQFPALAGEGLGSTLWPAINTSSVGQTWQTANGLAGGSATIQNGVSADQFSSQPNGTALAGAADLGAYFDTVVIPHVDAHSAAFVYLESAGFGINNSGDPVFTDTNGYDAVITAQQAPDLPGDLDGNGVVDEADRLLFIAALLTPESQPAPVVARADINGDGTADGSDIQGMIGLLP